VSIIAIKQGYIVKSVLFITFLCIMSLGLIGGCSDSSGGNESQALTENDFAEDSALRADLDGVVITFLESPMSEEAENDTGKVGMDLVPVAYRQSTEQTFCWEDDEASAMHFMELKDSQGSVILTVEANGDCVSEVIEEGNYVMSIHHDGGIEDTLPIFLIPNSEESEQARETEGLIDRFKLVASNILKRIERTVTKEAKAQTVMKNIDTLLSTRKCVECDLTRARFGSADLRDVILRDAILRHTILRFARLSGADFTGADLRDADLRVIGLQTEVIFTGADLRDADMRGANFRGADLRDADLRGAIMREVILRDADLRGADLTGADLFIADLRDADLTGAILTAAILRGALLGGATWYDGCRCFAGSSGMCEGCQRADDLFFP